MGGVCSSPSYDGPIQYADLQLRMFMTKNQEDSVLRCVRSAVADNPPAHGRCTAVDAQLNSFETLLSYATKSGYKDVVAALLAAGVPRSLASRSRNWDIMSIVVWHGDAAMLNVYMNAGVRAQPTRHKLCSLTAYAGNAAALVHYDRICAEGCSRDTDFNHIPEPYENGSTPLMYAAGRGQLPCFNILIKNGADPTASCRQGNALHAAAAGPGYWFALASEEPFDMEIECAMRYDVSSVDNPEQLVPIKYELMDYVTILRKLLAAGADLEARDKHGMTPIMVAAKHKHTAALLVLAEQRPDMSVASYESETVQSLLGMTEKPTLESITAFIMGGSSQSRPESDATSGTADGTMPVAVRVIGDAGGVVEPSTITVGASNNEEESGSESSSLADEPNTHVNLDV